MNTSAEDIDFGGLAQLNLTAPAVFVSDVASILEHPYTLESEDESHTYFGLLCISEFTDPEQSEIMRQDVICYKNAGKPGGGKNLIIYTVDPSSGIVYCWNKHSKYGIVNNPLYHVDELERDIPVLMREKYIFIPPRSIVE